MNVFFEHRHPIDGYVMISIDQSYVCVRCHWPLDVDSNEWMDTESCYSLDEYRSALKRAVEAGAGEVQPIRGGSLSVSARSDGFDLGISGAGSGWARRALLLHVKRPLKVLAVPPTS